MLTRTLCVAAAISACALVTFTAARADDQSRDPKVRPAIVGIRVVSLDADAGKHDSDSNRSDHDGDSGGRGGKDADGGSNRPPPEVTPGMIVPPGPWSQSHPDH